MKSTVTCRLRQQLAEQAASPAEPAPPPGAAAMIPETTVMAMFAAMQAQAQSYQGEPEAWQHDAPPESPRDPTPGPGWTLPERRKFRFRLEDVAFD